MDNTEDNATPEELIRMLADEPMVTPPEEVEPPAKKERKIFKGEQQKLADLLAKGEVVRGTPVQLIDRTVQGSKAKAPGLLILGALERAYYGEGVTVRAYNPRDGMRPVVYTIPRQNVMNILQGRMGEQLRAEFKEWEALNLNDSVPQYPPYIGTDPEIFVVDKDGMNIPAWKFLPDKKTPLKHTYGTAYWDGFQAEYTTLAGASCLAFFHDYVREGLLAIQKAAQSFDKTAKLSIASVMEVDPEVLAKAENHHVEFGCMPSKNAWGLSGRVVDARQLPIRFAGGHIHFGLYNALGTNSYVFDDKAHKANRDKLHGDEELQRRVIWSLDAILGVACVSLFEKWDHPARREFYGLPGEYRLPPHGLEYRTLSNAWLAHPVISNAVYEVGRRAFALGWFGKQGMWKAAEGEVLDCILRSDVEVARAILKRNEKLFKRLMALRLPNVDTLFDMFMRDMSEVIQDPTDIAKNWALRSNDPGWITHNDGAKQQWRTGSLAIMKGEKL